MSASTRLARRSGPIAIAAAACIGVALPSIAFAQTRKPAPAHPAPTPAPAPQAPAGQPNAQAAQQTGPMVVQVKAEPSQPDWTKVCGKDPQSNTEICYTTRDFVSDQGQPVLAAAIYDIKGPQPQKVARFLMPLGLLVQPGIRFSVDQGSPIPGRYTICFPNGCFAEATGLKDDFITSLKKAQHINVSVQNQVGREVTFAVPLEGFAKAFDGAPIDPKVLQEQQKKLQSELEKRSDDLRKKLEQSAAPGATPTPAAPAAK